MCCSAMSVTSISCMAGMTTLGGTISRPIGFTSERLISTAANGAIQRAHGVEIQLALDEVVLAQRALVGLAGAQRCAASAP